MTKTLVTIVPYGAVTPVEVVDLRKPVKQISKRKFSRFETESERYVAAAKLVEDKKMSPIDAVREVNICIADYVLLSKQVKGAYSDEKGKSYSESYKRARQVDKLLLLAELAKGE
jgi:hypothetical protein